MPADDRLRGMLDRFSSAPEPTDEQRDAARRQLQAAIRADVPQRRWWQRPAIGWSAAATVAAAIVAFVLVVPTSTPPVDANLANIAAVARTVDVTSLPDGSYVYYRIDSTVYSENQTDDGRTIAYRLPTTQDVWVSSGSELSLTTAHPPLFLSEEDEQAFYSSNLPAAEGIGETRELPLTEIPNETDLEGLSDDPSKLWQQIVDQLAADDESAGQDEARILEQVAQLLTPRLNAPPTLRAALIEVIGRLDVSTEMTSTGGVVVIQRYQDDFGSYEQTLRFDALGYLIEDSLTLLESIIDSDFPTGPLQEITYSRPYIVTEPGEFPAR